METYLLFFLCFPYYKSPLAGDINWMETLIKTWSDYQQLQRPHSLGILIEWKLNGYTWFLLRELLSPLAGDINWMETNGVCGLVIKTLTLCPHSLGILIEWKPEAQQLSEKADRVSRSPLAGDINWMETILLNRLGFPSLRSPLAGDINWMETDLRQEEKENLTTVPTRWGY